ncbi:MAG: RIP metalloprotease RseP [Holosporaceae bacterium]|jgi:regulator of sigma E protease|nr:RIP metalloprotease RseP [Rhodospirillaceae bacterium]
MDFMSIFHVIQQYFLPFIGIITLLVFVHEAGHFLAARWCGVRVEVFSIGFGPELFGWNDRHQTRWKFSLLPLGGYVKMYGDSTAASTPDSDNIDKMSPEERAVSFHGKNLRQKALIVVAGPAANFLFAWVLLTLMFVFIGQTITKPIISEVVAGSAAEQAGFQVGDEILSVNGRRLLRFQDLQRAVQLGLNEPLAIEYRRGDQVLNQTVNPVVKEITDRFGAKQYIGMLGVKANGVEVVPVAPLDAAPQAVVEIYDLSVGTLKAIGQIIRGARSAEDLGGPLRIAQMSGDYAAVNLDQMLYFLVLLSCNLGLINLLPLPALDGGHLFFYIIEGLRGRPLALKIQEYSMMVGVALVASLMVFVTYNDIRSLKLLDFIGL